MHKVNKNVNIFYGYDSVDRFNDYINKLIEQQKQKHKYEFNQQLVKNPKTFNQLKKKYKITFWAHNSGNYDMFLILDKLENVKKIIKKGGFLSVQVGDYIEFKDFYKHCSSKLSSLCKAFEIDEKYYKTTFPHDFLNEIKI